VSYPKGLVYNSPRDLIRIYGFHDYHYITCSSYQRKPFMGSVHARDVFVEVFDKVRARYRFEVLRYVVMPEHFHFMITEPDRADPSVESPEADCGKTAPGGRRRSLLA